jgi:hypothetical protein
VFYDRLRAALGDEVATGHLTVPERRAPRRARLAAIDDAFAQFRESHALGGRPPRAPPRAGPRLRRAAGLRGAYEFAEVPASRASVRHRLRADPTLEGAHRGLATSAGAQRALGRPSPS